MAMWVFDREEQRGGKVEMDSWKEIKLQNIVLNIKSARLTAPVHRLLIHRISVRVWEHAHVSVLPKPSKTG